MKRATLLLATMLLGLLLAAGVALANTVINTIPMSDGEVHEFGNPDTATYGQVVTAPADDTQLDSFTFLMNVPDTVVFRGEVYAWDGEKATGPNLYESRSRTTSGSGIERVTFSTGGVKVRPGQQYVLFATVSKDYEVSSGVGSWGFVWSGDAYAGGAFVFMNNGPAFDALFTEPWYTDWGGQGNDLAFKATFSDPYVFDGFFSPVDNRPTLNVVQAGRAVPVKFSLGGNEGLDIFAAGYPKSRQIDCASSAPLDGIEQTISAGESTLSYDPTTERYTYVWKTQKAWSGTCRQLVVQFDDGSVHRANFKFR